MKYTKLTMINGDNYMTDQRSNHCTM